MNFNNIYTSSPVKIRNQEEVNKYFETDAISKAKLNSANKNMRDIIFKKADEINDFDLSKDEGCSHSAEKKQCEQFKDKQKFDLKKSGDITMELTIWRKKKIRINKSLFAFRVAQFLWFGAGGLPSIFLGIFLKQRGLTLVELSSIFSMIFLFQFLSCFITGIITDMIGNAKPVLVFLMLSTSLVLVLMCLTPNINSVSCSKKEEISDFSNISESKQNFSSCYFDCLQNNCQTKENFTNTSICEDISFIQRMDTTADNSTGVCEFLALVNNSLNLPKQDCCYICANNTKSNCIIKRKEYLVAIYATLIIAIYSLWNTAFRFLDFTAVSLAAKNNSHYGKERLFATCGMLLTIIIGVFLLNISKTSGSKMSFDPVIWIATVLQFCAFLTLFMTQVPILPPGKNLMRKAFGLLKDIDVLAFILLVFTAGNGFAFNFTFHLVFLETLNASSIVISLHSVAIYLYALPVLLTSKWWLKNFGANKLFVLSLLSYTVNNIAFSYIFNPWLSLLIDVTIAFSYHLFWIAVVVHCRDVAPEGFAATLNAVTGAVHFGIGRSSGVFFGGMLMNYFGTRTSYRIMAAIFFTSALLYSIFLCRRRKSLRALMTFNEEKAAEINCSMNTDSQDV